MIENTKLALKAIREHKLRSFLTMLGIIIGIAAIIAIFCIISGNTEKMKQGIVGSGNNSIDILYGSKATFRKTIRKSKEEYPSYVPLIPEKEINQLDNAPEIKNATLFQKEFLRIFYGDKSIQANVSAIAPKFFAITPHTLVEGRFFNESDYDGNKQVILLPKDFYQELFPRGNGINQLVEINGIPFKVIGVVVDPSRKNEYTERQAFVPFNNWSILSQKVNPQPTVRVQTRNTDQLKPISNQVIRYLNQKIPASDFEFGVNDYEEIAKNLEEINQSNFIMLVGIASIPLLVGGIGVMNIMLVSVTERTKEIGLKKALGARRSIILAQFLIEAITLSFIAGVIGVVLGIGVGFLVSRSMDYPFILSEVSIIGSLLFSSTIGIVFGFLPAYKAAKLSPIEALKFE